MKRAETSKGPKKRRLEKVECLVQFENNKINTLICAFKSTVGGSRHECKALVGIFSK